MPLQFAIPRRFVDKFLRKMTPLVKETVELLTEYADDDGLTPKLKEWNKRYQVAGWAGAYEDFNNFLGAHFAVLPALSDSLQAIPKPDRIETLEDAQCWLDSVWQACERVLDDDSDEWIDTIIDETPEPLEYCPIDDDGTPITRQAVIVMVSLIIAFNYFSCMVHRKSLFQLVAEAKDGNDESLLKAAHIDKRCLTDIAYFRDRVAQAVQDGDDKFLRRVAQHRRKPTFQSATKLHPLYLVFGLLDALGLLESYADDVGRFADLCQSLGVYGPDDDVADLDSFARTLRRFRAEYRTLGPPREKWLIVKDTD